MYGTQIRILKKNVLVQLPTISITTLLIHYLIFLHSDDVCLDTLTKAIEQNTASQKLIIDNGFSVIIRNDTDKKQAAHLLWESCRKPGDGIVSRYFNRHISLFFSKRLVSLPIRPNHISIFSIILGIVAGLVTLQADYASILLGALLLQFNSIIDGVDGEIARVKWQFSKVGELLDSVGDHTANFSFLSAFVYALFQNELFLYGQIGIVFLAMWAAHIFFLHYQVIKMKRGDILLARYAIEGIATGALARFIHLLRTVVLRRDAYIAFIFCCVALGAYRFLTCALFIASCFPFAGLVIQTTLSSKKRGVIAEQTTN